MTLANLAQYKKAIVTGLGSLLMVLDTVSHFTFLPVSWSGPLAGYIALVTTFLTYLVTNADPPVPAKPPVVPAPVVPPSA